MRKNGEMYDETDVVLLMLICARRFVYRSDPIFDSVSGILNAQ